MATRHRRWYDTPRARRLVRVGPPLVIFVSLVALQLAVFDGLPDDTRSAWLFGAALLLIAERVLSATRQARPESLTVIGLAVAASAWGLHYDEVSSAGMPESLFEVARWVTLGAGLACVVLGLVYLAQAISGRAAGVAGAASVRWFAVLGLLGVSLAAALWDHPVHAIAGFLGSVLTVVRFERLLPGGPGTVEPRGRVSRGTTTERVVATGDFVGLPVGQTFVVRAAQQALLCQADRLEVVGASRLAGSTTHARIIGRLDDEQAVFDVAGVGLSDPGAPVELAGGDGASAVPPDALAWNCGTLAGSRYAVYLNLREAITHHTLLVGTTGSRKTSFVVELIRAAREKVPGLAIVVLDVTGQWAAQLERVETLDASAFEAAIAVQPGNVTVVSLASDADLAQTTVKVTEDLLKELAGTESAEPRVLVVLEEAHSLVPEVRTTESRRMGRVIAQSRKYGLGFICVTQRTTSVSKDVTALCNTLVALRSFDEATRDVAGAYATSDFTRVLPVLADGRALVAGRGVHANTPLIVDVHTRQLR